MRASTARLCLLATLAGASLLPAAPPARAANGDTMMFTLDSVTFSGNQRVTTEKLQSVVGLTPGQKVNRDAVVQAFQNVTDEYQHENVGGNIQPKMIPHGSHLAVVFEISEAAPVAPHLVQPVLDHETFTGNVKIPTERLQPTMTIKPGSPVTTPMVAADLNALGDAYKAAKVGATITPKITNLPEGHVDINFEIVEGNGKHAP